jgi:hypothetical protein
VGEYFKRIHPAGKAGRTGPAEIPEKSIDGISGNNYPNADEARDEEPVDLLCRNPLFLYEAPLLRHQSPVRGRGALGYNNSDLREIV